MYLYTYIYADVICVCRQNDRVALFTIFTPLYQTFFKINITSNNIIEAKWLSNGNKTANKNLIYVKYLSQSKPNKKNQTI